jgi:hypothetical protein
MPVTHASSVPIDTARTPPGMRPLNLTRPKYVSITIASVVNPTSGRANVRNRKPSEMKLSAMPASVDSSAARGVILRSRSATGAAASSMTPDAKVANSPACQATRTGSAAPAAIASVLAGSITRNTCANSDTVLMP